ncbi:NAD(P)/FAD-dependent oxidoreductase [Dickeya solani]|uniref:FAD-dependent oxidoreductase n=1 Tax=Dickeya solani TaxID=1089444 RepID=A0AAX4EYR7_9GAMM|nr:FAD-dependent oxidoreductase [Dickeya solani]WOA52536.1 FAD-dependent oxidoreductase [Dickeya solani]
MQKKSVLVIGGGAAGHQIAYQLRDAANVTLVDPKTYWEVPMAVPRLLVDPDGLAARIPYDSFLGMAQHIQGKVVMLTDHSARVALADGREDTVSFDYAVIATGSAYIDPLIKARAPLGVGRAAEIKSMNKRLREASAVVVAGGGPVGIEIAAELCEAFPGLAIALVHSGKSILNNAPDKFPRWAEKDLRAKGVKFALDDRVVSPAPGEQPQDGKVITQSGLVLAADAVVWAAGAKPVTDFVARSWPDAVQRDGLITVDHYLRVKGHETVFAAGDITHLPENRLAIVAGLHAKSIVTNIRALIAAKPSSQIRLKPYKPANPGKGMGKIMIVTLGRNDGLTSLPFGQFRAPFLARKIKSRDMLVGLSRKAVGL